MFARIERTSPVPPFAGGIQTGGRAVADETGGNGGPVQGPLHNAWWGLFDYGGTVDPVRGPFQRLPLPEALQILSTDDATKLLSESVRWAALTRLARSGQ